MIKKILQEKMLLLPTQPRQKIVLMTIWCNLLWNGLEEKKRRQDDYFGSHKERESETSFESRNPKKFFVSHQTKPEM